MSLSEIKGAVCKMSPDELTKLATFIYKEDNAAWDEQIEKDAASGKLSALYKQAARESN